MSKSSLRRGLLETRVLLEIRSGHHDAVRFALDMLTALALEVSELSAMALLAASQDPGELSANEKFLRNNRVHRVTAPISRAAFRLLLSLSPPAPLTADDAIIAATAIEQSLPLYTLDPARFATVPGLNALQPY